MASYAYTYGCGESEAVHYCHDCPDGRSREFGRTLAGGFIKKSFLATIVADPTNQANWQTGIDDGMVIILPETSGTYDPGDPKELKGFGNRRVTYGKRTMKLTLNDPDYKDNYAFYNGIIDRTDLVPFFLTSSLLHLFDQPATIKAKDPVADDLEEEITWQVECEVVSKNLPSLHEYADIADIFSCANF